MFIKYLKIYSSSHFTRLLLHIDIDAYFDMSGIFQSQTHLKNSVTYVIQIIQTTSWLFNALIVDYDFEYLYIHILVWVELCQHVCQYFLTSFHISLDWRGLQTSSDYIGDFLIGNLASILFTWTNKLWNFS